MLPSNVFLHAPSFIFIVVLLSTQVCTHIIDINSLFS